MRYECRNAARQLNPCAENLLDAIDDLPDEALLEPGIVFYNWRIADILGVIAAWESVVTGLAEIQRRKSPPNCCVRLTVMIN